MLKTMSLRKIMITTLALIVVVLFSFFPKKNSIETDVIIKYNTKEANSNIFLLDKYNYLSRVNVYIDNDDLETIVSNKIELIKENNNNLPNEFRGLLPKDTKILDIRLNNNILEINFSKEFLNIKKEMEEKLIECLIFTLTEIEDVDYLKIFVEGEKLKELTNSKKILPELLSKNFGINKEYDITSLKNMNKTIIYYTSLINNEVYYTPVTKITNTNAEKITIIIDELKSSVIYQSNLNSYLKSTAELEKYEIVNETMNLTFNNKIFDSIESKEILEEVKYTISLSVKDNYGINNINFYVDGKKV